MNIQLQNIKRPPGFALVMVLIMAAISIIILAAIMNRTTTIANLNQRNNEYNSCCSAAEAAVEKAYARMAFDFANYSVGQVSNNMTAGIYRTNIPMAVENSYWSNFNFADGQNNSNSTYVGYAYTYNGPLPSAYFGLFAYNSPVYRIVSNTTQKNSRLGVVGTAQADVLLALVPLTTWAIFYNGRLEFSGCAPMVVNGRVHANGEIYVGTFSPNSLTFNDGVTCTKGISAPLMGGYTSWDPLTSSTWKTSFSVDPVPDAPNVTVSLAMTNSHFLIDIPPAGELATSQTGDQRLYNQAQMILIVTNSPTGTNPVVTLTLQTGYNGQRPGSDPSKVTYTYTNASPGVLATNLPFLTLTNKTYDQREKATNLFTQIDVGRFNTWVKTNSNVQSKISSASGLYPTILYTADRRTKSTKQLPAIRLINGAQLPSNNGMGFTVATPNPLYVLGDYNVQTATSGTKASASTTDTSATVPAALMSDALTVLSPNWTDSDGYGTYSSSSSTFDAADMTINAAIVTGTIPSTGSTATTFSGGVHNLPRLLEDWSGRTLWLNTSILRLWDSTVATNQFQMPGNYYNAPNRNYSFDQNFLSSSKVPPGIPVALVPIRFGWGVPPPNVVNFTPQHN